MHFSFSTIPGPKMIWQFGELGYDISIDDEGRTGEKPIIWEYFSDIDRHRLFEFIRFLIISEKHSRYSEQPIFHILFHQPENGYSLISTDMKVNILGNFGVSSVTINPAFQQTGKWYEYFYR